MTQASTIAGGRATSALSIVSADQETIVGDGTTENPLRVADGAQSILCTYNAFQPAVVGMPVNVTTGAITAGTVARVSAANKTTQTSASAIGLITEVVSSSIVRVQLSGLVTLTVAQWAAITGNPAGLVQSEGYWVSVAGQMDDVPPAVPGDWIAQIGYALTDTIFLLGTPSAISVVP